jgi:hypothetical protein
VTGKYISRSAFIVLSFIWFSTASGAGAQTNAFNARTVRLRIPGAPAANYDFEFRLFDPDRAMVLTALACPSK